MKHILKRIDWIVIAQVLLVSLLVFAPLLVADAQLNRSLPCDATTGLNCSAGTDVNALIRTVINWLLAIAFGIAVLFLIIGGFQYIISARNEEAAEKGKGTAVNALIGIVIIILSYVIVNVVSNFVGKNVG